MSQNQAHIRVEQTDAILKVMIHRPRKKNALTLSMYEDLTAAIIRAEETPEVRVLVMTGEGDAFTSGNDLGDFMQSPPTSVDTPVFRFLKALLNFSKPLIASVNGLAIGIGTTMLLHCDFVYASEEAQFQLPFIRLGLVPEAGASLLFPQMIGHRRAAELLMLGERFSASEAVEYGLVNQVIPADALMGHTLKTAERLATLPPSAMRETKRLLKAPQRESLEAVMLSEGEVFMRRLSSPETAEAIGAFFMKREPDFSSFT